MSENDKKKADEYAVKIMAVLQDLHNKDSENYIDLKEIMQENNATAFFHALGTLAPAAVYNAITVDKTDMLQFNQLLNSLIFQFSGKHEQG